MIAKELYTHVILCDYTVRTLRKAFFCNMQYCNVCPLKFSCLTHYKNDTRASIFDYSGDLLVKDEKFLKINKDIEADVFGDCRGRFLACHWYTRDSYRLDKLEEDNHVSEKDYWHYELDTSGVWWVVWSTGLKAQATNLKTLKKWYNDR